MTGMGLEPGAVLRVNDLEKKILIFQKSLRLVARNQVAGRGDIFKTTVGEH